MQWEDFPQFQEARKICQEFNLEKALNDDELLQDIYDDTFREIGLSTPQGVNNEMFMRAQESVIFRYVIEGRIDSKKMGLLVSRCGEGLARRFVVCTAIVLMERWKILGQPKIF